jgi:hypothetical protein
LDAEERAEQEAWETDDDEDDEDSNDDKDGKDDEDGKDDTDNDDKDDDDNFKLKADDRPLDTWVDLHEGLTEEEVTELNESTRPVRLMLVKV